MDRKRLTFGSHARVLAALALTTVVVAVCDRAFGLHAQGFALLLYFGLAAVITALFSRGLWHQRGGAQAPDR
jgi:hypothetical protein